ncbi:MAG: hypothetical protein ACKOXT_00410 [Actinomycetota bacterium]
MQQKPVQLVGIYNADGGLVGELKYFFGHLVGIAKCELCDVTHSPIRRKAAFDRFREQLLSDFGLEIELLHLNERNPAQQIASDGQVPCVLAQFSDGSFSMLLDRVDLRALRGDVGKFDQLVRARLGIYF